MVGSDFKISSEQEKWIEDQCDDTAGMLVKMSTLKFIIEKFVNEQIEYLKINNTTDEDLPLLVDKITFESNKELFENRLNGK